jgi:hypothetical protein
MGGGFNKVSQGYVCCFCGGTGFAEKDIGVVQLVVITNSEKPVDDPSQETQVFWCHSACLRRVFHPRSELDVIDVTGDENAA